MYLSAIPGNIVDPPDNTQLAYRSLRMSTSHFMMELYVVSWIPADSIPVEKGEMISLVNCSSHKQQSHVIKSYTVQMRGDNIITQLFYFLVVKSRDLALHFLEQICFANLSSAKVSIFAIKVWFKIKL